MKRLTTMILWSATLMGAVGQTEELTPQQLEAILKRLSALQESSDSRFASRFRTAVQAFRGGMVSDEAAFALYMSCLEKLDFTDNRKKASEFREWREKNAERLKDAAFRRALRHQLRWLVLTLQASSENADKAQLAASAGEIVDAIVGDVGNLKGHQSVLSQSVLGSYFARAYDINRVKTEEWVMSPGQIGEVYDQIIFPPLRERQRADQLRTLWTKRIQQEIRLAEVWKLDVRPNTTGGQPVGGRSAEHDKYMNEEVPRMQWRMEIDVFKHGDPAGAAMRMITHLERNAQHPSAAEWIAELQDLLTGEDPEGALEEGESVGDEASPAPDSSAPQGEAPDSTGAEEGDSVFTE